MTAANPEVAALLAQLVQQLLATDSPAIAPEPRPEMSQECVFLTVEQAAKRLGIGRTSAWRLIRTGELESVRIGTLRRVPTSAVDEYVTRLIQLSREKSE